MKILIKNGRVIDPASNFDEVCDVAVAAGRISSADAQAKLAKLSARLDELINKTR